MRPTVFVIHEPLRRDRATGEMYPMHDLSPAAEFGDIRVVLPSANRPALDPEASLPLIREAMADFAPDDYLVLVGDINLVCWAAALAARATDGAIRLLRWDGRGCRYVALEAQLWAPDDELERVGALDFNLG